MPSMTSTTRGREGLPLAFHALSRRRQRIALASFLTSPVWVMSFTIRRASMSSCVAVSEKSSGAANTKSGLSDCASQDWMTIHDLPQPSSPCKLTTSSLGMPKKYGLKILTSSLRSNTVTDVSLGARGWPSSLRATALSDRVSSNHLALALSAIVVAIPGASRLLIMACSWRGNLVSVRI